MTIGKADLFFYSVRFFCCIFLTFILLTAVSGCGGGAEQKFSLDVSSLADAQPVSRTEPLLSQVIVKLREDPLSTQYRAMTQEYANELSAIAGVRLKPFQVGFQGAVVLDLGSPMSESEARLITQKLAAKNDIEFAEPNVIAQASLIPNDAKFPQQWNLRERNIAIGGANLPDAWDVTKGDPSLVIAVLDTGILRHSELSGRLLTGYDFVSNVSSGNDGNGRDLDSADPGNWISSSELNLFDAQRAKPSNWHGTHVAGTIAAGGGNGIGVVGVNWQSKILPVRVLGKGGGPINDIADGLAWAAGASISGIPNNTNPARVINMSLGGTGACPSQLQQAINYAVSKNVVIVVSAGNEGALVDQKWPANCTGVIAVAAIGQNGSAARYTNFGKHVHIAAPGGDLPRDAGILSLGDGGDKSPLNDNTYMSLQGTSMAAPHVAGIVSLMLSVNPGLSFNQIKTLLQSTAQPFPKNTGLDCNVSLCGAGIVNAAGAVRAAASGEPGIQLGKPQSGWWWNAAEGGRGFALEIRDGKLFFAGFLYEANGRSTWFASGPTAMQSETRYVGTLDRYFGGQTLNGTYKTPIMQESVGSLVLTFTDATHAVISWPGGSVNIERFEFVEGGVKSPITGFTPESGWWWNPTEGGRGFAIEIQNNSMFMASFLYDDAGNPVWNVSTGPMASPNQFVGDWLQYANGQSLTGSYKSPQVVNAKAGQVRVNFSDSTHATMTLPNGRIIPLERFTIGYQSPLLTIPPAKLLSSTLIGIWNYSYKIINSFNNFYLLDTLRESSTTPGMYNVWGYDIYDNLVLASYDPLRKNFSTLALGISIDYFYIFNPKTPPSTDFSGCYYQIPKSTGKLSTCYPLNVIKLDDVTPMSFSELGKGSMQLNEFIERRLLNEGEIYQASKQSSAQAFKAAPMPLNDSGPTLLYRQMLNRIGEVQSLK